MEAFEVWDACRALERELGVKSIDAFISDWRRGVWLMVDVTANGEKFTTEAHETWESALAEVREAWGAKRADFEIAIVRNIALAIIRITFDMGECTEQALRVEFSAADIERFGSAAIERANTMAEGAPFSIVGSDAGNGAPE